jgi:two-component system, LuxR family, response regulator FixJ
LSKTSSGLVYVVDDDAAILDSLAMLLKSVALPCRAYSDAGAFLDEFDPAQHACLLADIRMPGMSGLELQDEINRRGAAIPIIFMTGHGDVPTVVKAMKAGALEFIQKPFRDEDLIRAINVALEVDLQRIGQRRDAIEIRRRADTLTPRELEVMRKVVEGCANKVIAFDLGVSQRTVELHRARVMHKMEARSLAELVRMEGEIDD